MGCVVNKNTTDDESDSCSNSPHTPISMIKVSKYHPRMYKYKWGNNLRTIKEVASSLESSLELSYEEMQGTQS